MRKKILIISLVTILSILIALSFWWFYHKSNNINNVSNTNSTKIFQANAQGLQVTPVTEPTEETKEISATGGEIKLDLTSNTAVALNLPTQSLPETKSITLKKINALTNLPPDMQFVSGVEVGPDGTLLDKPANLTMALSPDQSAQPVVGFSFSGDGKEFHLYPIKLANNVATFQLTGFSGYGILLLQDTNTTPPAPSTIAMQAKQYIATIALTAGKKGGSVDADALKKIKNILTGWYNASVKPNLAEAKTNDEKIDSAVHEYISWLATVQFFGLDASFKTEINQSLDAIATAINNASVKAGKVCKDEKDPTQAAKLMRYAKIVQLLGLEGKAGITTDKINKLIENCVNFKLKITSKTTETTYNNTVTEVEASGTGTIAFQDDMKLKGSAEVTVTRNQLVSMKPCTSNVPETWKFDIPEFSLATASTGSQFSMPIDLSLPNDGSIVWECGASLRDIVADASVTDPNSAWDFDILHKDEQVGPLGDPTSYLLKDWQVLGKGDVFAKKVYNRTINDPFGAGVIDSYHEETTLELIPTPK